MSKKIELNKKTLRALTSDEIKAISGGKSSLTGGLNSSLDGGVSLGYTNSYTSCICDDPINPGHMWTDQCDLSL